MSEVLLGIILVVVVLILLMVGMQYFSKSEGMTVLRRNAKGGVREMGADDVYKALWRGT